MKMEYISKSEKETQAIATDLGKRIKAGDVIALYGEMGAGKTAFVRGLAAGMGVVDYVSSPTFAIAHEYAGPIPLYHYDMYPIETWDDLCSTGFFESVESGAAVVIEWSEHIENALPAGYIGVLITKGLHESERLIRITVEREGVF